MPLLPAPFLPVFPAEQRDVVVLKDKQKQGQALRPDITESYIHVQRCKLAACSVETCSDIR